MTPKEKADDLIHNIIWNTLISKKKAKTCALIVVNETIDQWEYIDTYLSDLGGEFNTNLVYWYEVKQEIEKLSVYLLKNGKVD